MHEWQVAGGLLVSDGELLLVENHRRGGRVDWSPPGGVVDPGETAVDALTREVLEETGISVTGWTELAYTVDVVAPDMDWHLSVEVHRAAGWDGAITLDDPDGIVRAAAFCAREQGESRLAAGPPWVAEPLLAWWSTGERTVAEGNGPIEHRYRVLGTDIASLEVIRM